MKAMASAFGKKRQVQEYLKRAQHARLLAATDARRATQEYAMIRKKYPEFNSLYKITANFYHEALHDARHEAGMKIVMLNHAINNLFEQDWVTHSGDENAEFDQELK